MGNLYRTDLVPSGIRGDIRLDSHYRFWHQPASFEFDYGISMDIELRAWDAGEHADGRRGMAFMANDSRRRLLGVTVGRDSFNGQAWIRPVTGGYYKQHPKVNVASTWG